MSKFHDNSIFKRFVAETTIQDFDVALYELFNHNF